MSYPKDLDEFEETDLLRELEVRREHRDAGRCSYCHRKVGAKPACRFAGRHEGRRGNNDGRVYVVKR